MIYTKNMNQVSNEKTSFVNFYKSLYLSEDDIEFLVSNGSKFDSPNYLEYFDKMKESIPLSSFQRNNPEDDRNQWLKVCFNWMVNYNKNLSIPAEKLAKVCFKVYYEEDIESCGEPTGKLYDVRDGRRDIGNIR